VQPAVVFPNLLQNFHHTFFYLRPVLTHSTQRRWRCPCGYELLFGETKGANYGNARIQGHPVLLGYSSALNRSLFH
jgi:hypothetical protein